MVFARMTTNITYKLAALGGTFDHFHKGHKAFLRSAFNQAQRVIVGITDEKLHSNKDFVQTIENYQKRADYVKNFVEQIGRIKDLQIVKLTDNFGPTLGQVKVDVLICSPLTRIGAEMVNMKRLEKKLPILPIKICKMVSADDGDYLSSTRIRKGEINRQGFLYRNLFDQDININPEFRIFCKNPLGKLISNANIDKLKDEVDQNGLNVVVGDFSGKYFLDNKFKSKLMIFDGKSKKEKYESDLDNLEYLVCQNPAGQISSKLGQIMEMTFYRGINIKIKGEEDLAVIPAVLLLPLGTKIFYGQFDKGIVVVKVTEEKKELLKKFLD